MMSVKKRVSIGQNTPYNQKDQLNAPSLIKALAKIGNCFHLYTISSHERKQPHHSIIKHIYKDITIYISRIS